VCASLATGLVLTSGTAEARFGKRSDSSSSSSSEKKEEKREERKHEASPVNSSGSSSSSSSSRRHEATPVGSSGSNTQGTSSYATSTYSGSSSVTVVSVSDDHPPVYPYSHTPQVVRQPAHRSPVLVRMGLTGQALGGGGALGLNLGLEGKRWGVDGSLTALKLPTDDGTEGEDQLGLYSTHLTYALLSSDEGRLRAEAGVAIATAPDVTFVGPSIALSFERCLFGGLDVEGRGQLVALPYTQLDAQAGLALHMGILTVRGGLRWLLLNDHGLVDSKEHEDVFTGPYAGLGLNF
jgi:hypothetical protein